MGWSFPIEVQPESASHFRTGFRDAVSSCIAIGKPHPALSVDSGMNFLLGRRRESVSHFEIELWDAVSGWTAIGKSHPAFELNSGMHFPLWRLRESMSRSESVFRDALSGWTPMGKVRPISASQPASCALIGKHRKLGKQARQIKSRLKCVFQPAANVRLCFVVYERAPSRKKRRLK